MQDIRQMGSGGGRIFAGERRLRPHPNQALKCPRCESLNTKFCYYNNYNLSQPRHFCKGCRRYWTKGGVLRNVPVGGGCRKTKRTKHKPSPEVQKERKSTSHSSSESSSLTATTTTENFPDSRLFVSQNPNPNFQPSMMDTVLDQPFSGGILPENGSFTSLMTDSNSAFMGFNFENIWPLQLQQQNPQHKMTNMAEEQKMQELTAGFLNQTVPVELPGSHDRASNGGLTALDWESSNGDQCVFDLPSSIDQEYWSQCQWTTNERGHAQNVIVRRWGVAVRRREPALSRFSVVECSSGYHITRDDRVVEYHVSHHTCISYKLG
ncbi:hypothetical protein HHK36_024412 [Tetracentron sinense]|uniref:Dof zinc finger protein n=1 Tax=Tetracentron sinense TaxID=13715 RepID=A0A834YIY0_TETSI|nr:hypothetical protein HHK36_024412 [Tetracentron sinense]